MLKYSMASAARYILATHGVYYVITGIWPALHLQSFMKITGYKADIWLVCTFGLLLFTTGLVFIRSSGRKKIPGDIKIMSGAIGTVLALADIYYCAKGVISNVYLIDAGIQLALAAAWVIAGLINAKQTST